MKKTGKSITKQVLKYDAPGVFSMQDSRMSIVIFSLFSSPT